MKWLLMKLCLCRDPFRNVARHLALQSEPVGGKKHFIGHTVMDAVAFKYYAEVTAACFVATSRGPIPKLFVPVSHWDNKT